MFLVQVYSQIGRTRTTPRADADIARTRIAFFGCSQLPLGFFTAYGWAAQLWALHCSHMSIVTQLTCAVIRLPHVLLQADCAGRMERRDRIQHPHRRVSSNLQCSHLQCTCQGICSVVHNAGHVQQSCTWWGFSRETERHGACCSYIYETERNASELILPQYRAARTHFPAKEILSVADYRARHNQYSECCMDDGLAQDWHAVIQGDRKRHFCMKVQRLHRGI